MTIGRSRSGSHNHRRVELYTDRSSLLTGHVLRTTEFVDTFAFTAAARWIATAEREEPGRREREKMRLERKIRSKTGLSTPALLRKRGRTGTW